MPYYIYIVTTQKSENSRSLGLVSEYDSFKTAKTEVKRLRAEAPLADNQIYKIIFAADQPEAEKSLIQHRDEPIAREWEK
ncbi:MAG TPA: hypothetical protein VM011_10815 [Gammaproteobacteria bacterium]|nr:hypothetical protein [Gammaproteobacteria bacterium]